MIVKKINKNEPKLHFLVALITNQCSFCTPLKYLFYGCVNWFERLRLETLCRRVFLEL